MLVMPITLGARFTARATLAPGCLPALRAKKTICQHRPFLNISYACRTSATTLKPQTHWDTVPEPEQQAERSRSGANRYPRCLGELPSGDA
jgi:hypothetical protein